MARPDLRTLFAVGLTLVLAAVSTQALPLGVRADPVTSVYDDAGCGEVRRAPDEDRVPALRRQTLCLLNFERVRLGLAPLNENGLLDIVADAHSKDMVARGFHAHRNPDGLGPAERAREAGWRGGGGEVLHAGSGAQGSPAAIVDDWMQSPGNRAVVLSPRYREIGLGVAVRDGTATYTTNFGR